MKIRALLWLALLTACVPTSAMALDAKTFTLSGDYNFNSSAKKNGQPVCSERWRFNSDGTLVIHSGQEIVTNRFHIETDHDAILAMTSSEWIVTETLETNGQPDCMGHSVSRITPGERRIFVYPALDGNIVVCNPPRRIDAEHRVFDIFGWLVRAPESNQH
jgi:hypothetical protein